MNSGRLLRRKERGFTLIEMIIVIAIIMILSGIAVPIYTAHILHAREAVLQEDLYTLRNCIDQYTMDKSKAPQDLNELVTAGYIAKIPQDPFTHASDWQVVQEDTLLSVDQTAPGITNVHSASNLSSADGTAYSSW
jgi:general secretion pathway protein G